MDEMMNVATRFVDLALKYKQWSEVKTLPANEVQVLFETVSAAGFNPQKVIPGELIGNYLDQDGSCTGKTYPINSLCPFKVMDQKGEDHYFATGWLDCALRRVVYGSARQTEDREKIIKVMTEEIKRSVPLEPIQLTPEGDMLREYPPNIVLSGLEYFVDHTRDNGKVSCCVGIHDHCNSWMDRRGATETHDAITCRGCHIRVLFPKEVETYGDLRKALAAKRAQTPV